MRVEERSSVLFVENYSRIASLSNDKLAEINVKVCELMFELEGMGRTLNASLDHIHTELQQAYSQLLALRFSVIKELDKRVEIVQGKMR